jgi:hypothetical protein
LAGISRAGGRKDAGAHGAAPIIRAESAPFFETILDEQTIVLACGNGTVELFHNFSRFAAPIFST